LDAIASTRLGIRGGLEIGNLIIQGKRQGPPLLIVDGAQVPFEALNTYFPTEKIYESVYIHSTIYSNGWLMQEIIMGKP